MAAGAAAGVGLNQTLAALVTQRQARAGEFGVTRGTVLADLPEPWVLDATHSGNVCVLENGTPVFWRPDAKAAIALSVAPVGPQLDRQGAMAAGRGSHHHHHRRADARRRNLCRELQRQ